MLSLILAFITIAFLGTLAVVAINYTPWWIVRAQAATELACTGLTRLERAYDLAAAGAKPIDTPPTPLAQPDGGLQTLFQPYYGFLPKPPLQMTWSYGHQAAAGAFSEMDFSCLAGTSVQYGEYKGVLHLAQTMGAGQVVLSGTCGAIVGTAEPAKFPAPVALTYYVQHVAGVQ